MPVQGGGAFYLLLYDNEKENWRILTNKGNYAVVKKTTITGTIRLNGVRRVGHVERMEENRIPKKSLIFAFGNDKAER